MIQQKEQKKYVPEKTRNEIFSNQQNFNINQSTINLVNNPQLNSNDSKQIPKKKIPIIDINILDKFNIPEQFKNSLLKNSLLTLVKEVPMLVILNACGKFFEREKSDFMEMSVGRLRLKYTNEDHEDQKKYLDATNVLEFIYFEINTAIKSQDNTITKVHNK